VWDPHTKTLINKIEAVQNRAARFVTGNYERRSSVTTMKRDLHWEPLETRRVVTRLTIFQQAIAGHLAIPAHTILRPVERSSRLTSPEGNNFIQIQANKNCYKHSFLPRTIINWNSLPSTITSITNKDQFKQAANNHLTNN